MRATSSGFLFEGSTPYAVIVRQMVRVCSVQIWVVGNVSASFSVQIWAFGDRELDPQCVVCVSLTVAEARVVARHQCKRDFAARFTISCLDERDWVSALTPRVPWVLRTACSDIFLATPLESVPTSFCGVFLREYPKGVAESVPQTFSEHYRDSLETVPVTPH